MSADDVRATLAEETIMLDIMIGCLQSVDHNRFSQPMGKFIGASWLRFLRERRHAGVQLQKMDDAGLLADLTEERKQIEKYIAQTKGAPPFVEQWESFLRCEKGILDDLIKMI